MSKTAQERYDEIRREIIQISESYTLIKQNMNKEYPTKYEERHFVLLHLELIDLIKELNSLNATGEVPIRLLYKEVVNSLKRNLEENCGASYKEQLDRDIKLNPYLY